MLKRLGSLVLVLAVLAIPAVASAHVVVMPAQVGIGQSMTFTVSTPNEKGVPVIGLKLLIPSGLTNVTPTVKSGWTITTDKTGDGETATANSITWANGSIPAGFRDDFTFSAQAPAKSTSLNWKAYQTYQDGSVVSWDQTPTASEKESATSSPYSVTAVINDLAKTSQTSAPKNNDTLALAISCIALLVTIGALLFKKRA